MKWIKTIRIRFALWATVLILAILAAFGSFVYFNLSLSLHSAVDESLFLSASQTAATLNVDNGQITPPEAITPDETGAQAFTERGLTLVVLAKDGTILQAAGPLQAVPVAINSDNTQAELRTNPAVGNEDPTRVYILPVLDNGKIVGWVQALQSLGSVQDSLNSLLTALLFGGGLLGLFAGFAGYFLAARALAPIDGITNAARRISTADLSARLNFPDTGDEVSRLATTFDEMLARLESGFQRERQFTADASHELRTPLAAMQAILSVVREGKRPVAEYRQALDDLAEETDRMRMLVGDLLKLARGENGLKLQLETVNLSTLLSDVADSLRPLASAKNLALNCALPSGLVTRGDTDQLIRLFVNLIDNAIKYTEKGVITVSAEQTGHNIRVSFADTGIGIPPEHLDHIFERFYRVETARSTGGAGLGLAIAQQIVRAHSGEIAVESRPNVGTKFTIQLPLKK